MPELSVYSGAMHRYWFERIVPERLGVALVGGLLVWVVLALSFAWAMGAFVERATADSSSAWGTALFFATMNVYGVIAGAWVIRRCVALVDDMQLESSASKLELKGQIGGLSRLRAVVTLLSSLAAGLVHNMILQGTVTQVFANMYSSVIATAGSLGTFLSWVVVTHVVSAFVSNAERFAAVGEDAILVDLLQPENHNLIGRAALLPTLGLVGTQALYPLLWIGGEVNMFAVLPEPP